MMENDQFHLTLPSNSSMEYFPNNTTTHFITQLPHEIRLHGRWVVGLVEIQFPRTFLHVRHDTGSKVENRITLMTNVTNPAEILKNDEENRTHNNEKLKIDNENLLEKDSLPITVESKNNIPKMTPKILIIPDNDNGDNDVVKVGERSSDIVTGIWTTSLISHFRPGVYKKVGELVRAINQTTIAQEHIRLFFKEDEDCYVKIGKICGNDCEIRGHHFLAISEKISQILGFAPQRLIPSHPHYANHPASLARGLPDKLFVYCDICESRITGDVQTPLLRIIPVDIQNYMFASTQVTQFSSPSYIPLIHTEFRTIEIDIRDHMGLPIPFEFGTLTVTLHFKKID